MLRCMCTLCYVVCVSYVALYVYVMLRCMCTSCYVVWVRYAALYGYVMLRCMCRLCCIVDKLLCLNLTNNSFNDMTVSLYQNSVKGKPS